MPCDSISMDLVMLFANPVIQPLMLCIASLNEEDESRKQYQDLSSVPFLLLLHSSLGGLFVQLTGFFLNVFYIID